MDAITFKLNQHLFLRDPQHTELGRKIIERSIVLIERLGFEDFNFKKLAKAIKSTEASIYRYFENKYRLLQYLIAWYWNWMEYRLEKVTRQTTDPHERLSRCLHLLAEPRKYDPEFEFVNEELLHNIVVLEMNKTYFTKWVDDDNKEGLFLSFKSLCHNIAALILAVNPRYPYPDSLSCTLIITSLQQLFFTEHMSSLSNIGPVAKSQKKLEQFLQSLIAGATTKS